MSVHRNRTAGKSLDLYGSSTTTLTPEGSPVAILMAITVVQNFREQYDRMGHDASAAFHGQWADAAVAMRAEINASGYQAVSAAGHVYLGMTADELGARLEIHPDAPLSVLSLDAAPPSPREAARQVTTN